MMEVCNFQHNPLVTSHTSHTQLAASIQIPNNHFICCCLTGT